jgi:hypothetical protein
VNFIQVWLLGYINPARFVKALKDKPAPLWGLIGQVVRSLMISLLLYFPIALSGRIPSTPSYITLIPTEKYYINLIWLTPLVVMTEWLLGAVVIHIFLHLQKKTSNLDLILNVTGMASLVIGLILLVWDWIWFFVGGVNQYFLGITHLVIDLWWFVIVIIGLKEVLGISVRDGIVVCLLAFATSMPFAILFMRAPF